MGDALAILARRLRGELDGGVGAPAQALAEEIRARHGDAVESVVFYGSCLQHQRAEGVHDFYVVVDDYRSVYTSRRLRCSNALLPPNVFYCETVSGDDRLRAKYAVISRADLLRGCRPQAWRFGLWARFSQPLRATCIRDEAAGAALVDACLASLFTAVRFGLEVLAPRDDVALFSAESFWPALFRATYAAELRPERENVIFELYSRHAARFDAVLDETLAALSETGALNVGREGHGYRVRIQSPTYPISLGARRVVAKGLAAAQLVKSALTFGDWLPYALWKIERHTGTRLEPTDRQRRHPFLFAWPLLVRALRSGALR